MKWHFPELQVVSLHSASVQSNVHDLPLVHVIPLQDLALHLMTQSCPGGHS